MLFLFVDDFDVDVLYGAFILFHIYIYIQSRIVTSQKRRSNVDSIRFVSFVNCITLVVLAPASSSSSSSLQSPEEDGGGTATPSVASVVISV